MDSRHYRFKIQVQLFFLIYGLRQKEVFSMSSLLLFFDSLFWVLENIGEQIFHSYSIFDFQEVYCRDEGNLPDNHGNDFFEKIVRQVTNRIDKLKNNIKRCGSSSRGSDETSGRKNTPIRPSNGPG